MNEKIIAFLKKIISYEDWDNFAWTLTKYILTNDKDKNLIIKIKIRLREYLNENDLTPATLIRVADCLKLLEDSVEISESAPKRKSVKKTVEKPIKISAPETETKDDTDNTDDEYDDLSNALNEMSDE